ncbi:MAG: hypothetical protein C4551_08150 [Bacillota bacterium]|nr:MAG: hypothetical protein C4551_08150 [Bacillota bacterium]
MRVERYELRVRIDPWAANNLQARGTIDLVNGGEPYSEFFLYLHPSLRVTRFACPGARLEEPAGEHPLGYAGRGLHLTFEPPVKPGGRMRVSLAWEGHLAGIVWGYCMIAEHLVELRDFACWYPLPGGHVTGFSWVMDLDLPAGGYPLPTTEVCNGRLVGRRTTGERLYAKWTSADATTDINVLASSYFKHRAASRDRHEGRVYYAFMSHDQAATMLEQMLDTLEFLSAALGPNEKVEGPRHAVNLVFAPRFAEGGYVYGRLMVTSEPQYILVLNYPESARAYPTYGVAHELAHWWWREQVSVDRTTWHDWLMEALAEYWAARVDEWFIGRDKAVTIFADYRERVSRLRRAQPISRTTFDSGDRYVLWYVKGAWVLRMLEFLVGREAFDRAIREFYRRHRGRRVDTRDFIECFREVTRRDLEWFFEQWLERGEVPRLLVTWRRPGRAVEVDVEQEAEGACFRLDTELRLRLAGGDSRVERVTIEGARNRFRFDLGAGETVAGVDLDPGEVSLFRR